MSKISFKRKGLKMVNVSFKALKFDYKSDFEFESKNEHIKKLDDAGYDVFASLKQSEDFPVESKVGLLEKASTIMKNIVISSEHLTNEASASKFLDKALNKLSIALGK